MRKVLGLVDLHHDIKLGVLTNNRSIASTTFLGRYCFIDIPLSNFANSGVEKIGVLIQDKPRSLFRHLGINNPWAFNTKTGGLTLLYNEKYANNKVYNTDINNLLENYWYLKEHAHIRYVIIAPSHIVMTINYNEVLQYHINNNADVTLVYKENEEGNTKFLSCRELNLDGNIVKKIMLNKGGSKKNNVELNSYIINRETLIKMIEEGQKSSSLYTLKELIALSLKSRKVVGYQYKGFTQCYDSLPAYLHNSLELLDNKKYNLLFKDNWPIYTRTYDTPPVKYGKNADIRQALIANGSVINGTLVNSIVGRDVVIEEGSIVKNSILLAHVRITKDSNLDYVIVDKEAVVKNIKILCGTENEPIGIKQEDIV